MPDRNVSHVKSLTTRMFEYGARQNAGYVDSISGMVR